MNTTNYWTPEQLLARGYDEDGNKIAITKGTKISKPQKITIATGYMKKKRQYPEQELQAKCVREFYKYYPHHVLLAIENGKRSKLMNQIMSSLGAYPGASDMMLVHAKIGQIFDEQDFHGMFIEMKAKSKQSEKQLIFQKMVEKENYKYIVCRTLDEFMTEINSYLK